MLAELYVEALLANERTADEVWELWDSGLNYDAVAALTWWLVVCHFAGYVYFDRRDHLI